MPDIDRGTGRRQSVPEPDVSKPGAPKPGVQETDPRLLEILVCPQTRGPLEYDREARELVSRQAGLAYPIRDGIPIMLIDEARPLDDSG